MPEPLTEQDVARLTGKTAEEVRKLQLVIHDGWWYRREAREFHAFDREAMDA